MEITVADYIDLTACTSSLPDPIPNAMTLEHTELRYLFCPIFATEEESVKWTEVRRFITVAENNDLTVVVSPHTTNPLRLDLISLTRDSEVVGLVHVPTYTMRAYIRGRGLVQATDGDQSVVMSLRNFPTTLFSMARHYVPETVNDDTLAKPLYHANRHSPIVLMVSNASEPNTYGFELEPYIWLEKLHQLLSNGEVPNHMYLLHAKTILSNFTYSRPIFFPNPIHQYDCTHGTNDPGDVDLPADIVTPLLPFQASCVTWMKRTESKGTGLEITTHLYRAFGTAPYEFWFDPHRDLVHLGKPPRVRCRMRRGGFLNTPTGSGKTLMMLSLILSAPAPSLDKPLHHPGTLVLCHTYLVHHWLVQIKKHTSLSGTDVLVLWNGQTPSATYSDFRSARIVIAPFSSIDETMQPNRYRRQALNRRPANLLEHQHVNIADFKWHRVVIDECWRSCKQKDIPFGVRSDIVWLMCGSETLNRYHCSTCINLPLDYFARITGVTVSVLLNKPKDLRMLPTLPVYPVSSTELVVPHTNLMASIRQFVPVLYTLFEEYMMHRRLRVEVSPDLYARKHKLNRRTCPVKLTADEYWLHDVSAPRSELYTRYLQACTLQTRNVKTKKHVLSHHNQLWSTRRPADNDNNGDDDSAEETSTSKLIQATLQEFYPPDSMMSPVYPNCIVCFETMRPETVPVAALFQCGHIVCRMCIVNLLSDPDTKKHKCPACRAQVVLGQNDPVFFFTGDDDDVGGLDKARYGALTTWLIDTLLQIATSSSPVPRVVVYGHNAELVKDAKEIVEAKYPGFSSSCLVGSLGEMSTPETLDVLRAFGDPDMPVTRTQILYVGDAEGMMQHSNLAKMKGLDLSATTHLIMYDQPPLGKSEPLIREMIHKLNVNAEWPPLEIIDRQIDLTEDTVYSPSP